MFEFSHPFFFFFLFFLMPCGIQLPGMKNEEWEMLPLMCDDDESWNLLAKADT